MNSRVYSPDARRVASAMRRRPAERVRASRGALQRSDLYMDGQTVQRADVDTGRSRTAVSSRVVVTADRMQGIVEAAPLAHLPPLEYGRRPGSMPPPAALEGWVRRQLGVS